jgi:hypothetical protein
MEPAVATGMAGTEIVRVNQVVSDLMNPDDRHPRGRALRPPDQAAAQTMFFGSSCSSAND